MKVSSIGMKNKESPFVSRVVRAFKTFLLPLLIASPRAVSKVYNRETSENYSGS